MSSACRARNCARLAGSHKLDIVHAVDVITKTQLGADQAACQSTEITRGTQSRLNVFLPGDIIRAVRNGSQQSAGLFKAETRRRLGRSAFSARVALCYRDACRLLISW